MSRVGKTWFPILSAGFILTIFAGVCPAQPQQAAEPVTDIRLVDRIAASARVRSALQDRIPTEGGVIITDEQGTDRTDELLVPDIRLSDALTAGQSGSTTRVHGGDSLRVATREPVTMRMPAERVDLPGAILQSQRNASGTEVVFEIRPTLIASPLPAVWDTLNDHYQTLLSVGLRSSDLEPGKRLDKPVAVRFNLRGLNAEPFGTVVLERVGLEHEKELEFRFLPMSERPVLEMRSEAANIDLEIDAPPRIELRPDHDDMIGLGLDEVLVHVVRRLPHGEPAVVDNDLGATVEVKGSAVPEPRRPVIAAGQAETSFVVKSSGLDNLDIKVTAGRYSDEVTIEQHFPSEPVLFCLVGGALGGFSRRYTRGARRTGSGKRIVEGLVVAIIAFVAGVLGVGWIHLPAAIVATEAGAFLTGALAGFAGVTAIEWLGRKVTAQAV